jgi:hypothetical protein
VFAEGLRDHDLGFLFTVAADVGGQGGRAGFLRRLGDDIDGGEDAVAAV